MGAMLFNGFLVSYLKFASSYAAPRLRIGPHNCFHLDGIARRIFFLKFSSPFQMVKGIVWSGRTWLLFTCFNYRRQFMEEIADLISIQMRCLQGLPSF